MQLVVYREAQDIPRRYRESPLKVDSVPDFTGMCRFPLSSATPKKEGLGGSSSFEMQWFRKLHPAPVIDDMPPRWRCFEEDCRVLWPLAEPDRCRASATIPISTFSFVTGELARGVK